MAVGTNPHGCAPLAEWWDRHRWALQKGVDPCVADELDGVSCPSAQTCAAVGSFDVGACNGDIDYFVSVLGFWKRGRWSLHRTPKLACAEHAKPSNEGATAGAVSCKTATTCTAIGSNNRGSIIERWNGRH